MTYFKLFGVDSTVEEKILALHKGFLQPKNLCPFNLNVEGDSTLVISWVSYRERGSWKLDSWLL